MAGLAALTSVVAMTVIAPGTAQAAVICEKFGSTTAQGGRYVIQNNNWGDDTTQCITTTDQGFSVTTASHNKPTNGAPGAYPSVFAGCHWANCSSGSGLPLQASSSQFNSIQTSVSYTFPPASSGTTAYNASYDLWFDPTPRTDGQNTGAEIMIWLNRVGSIQPVGSLVGTANIAGATWDVWFGNVGWNVVSYVRQSPATSINFAVNTFYSDAISRGHAQRSWYLTSVQAGFEPWVGGVGLAVNNFTYSIGGGGNDTTAPSTPGTLSASSVTSSSVNLSWGASTDNVGVAGYDVLRATGSSGGTFSQVGTASGTSFSSTGLSPNTTYRYQVRARDAAGNTSPVSNTVTVTTPSGPGGGACAITASVQSQWSTGYVINVTVTNTSGSTTSGWSVPFTLPSGHQLAGGWGAALTTSGQSVTAQNLSYNGTLGPNQSTTWGFQASRPAGNTQLPTLPGCTSS
ncbi:MAG TPA: cellulose binding domain-containing protein [Streptosporangiaceae bacterium]|nr:cellulose binding domain-containing protein [Streptosporangiaceae bacterium]